MRNLFAALVARLARVLPFTPPTGALPLSAPPARPHRRTTLSTGQRLQQLFGRSMVQLAAVAVVAQLAALVGVLPGPQAALLSAPFFVWFFSLAWRATEA